MTRRRAEISSSIEQLERFEPGPLEDPLTLPPGEQFITRGALLRNRKTLVWLSVIVLLTASLLSFFVKPKSHLTDLVTPDQEMPGFEARLPGDTGLSKRVLNSYNMALVLIGSPYTGKNVQALENVRSWAQANFQTAPDFLHPVSIKAEQEPNDTVIGAFGYNLFAGVRYSLESVVGSFLRGRIADFHDEPAYQSFSESYFETYGKDSEAATLLARYQSDKAKGAIDVILWTLAYSVSLVGALFYIAFSPRRQRFDRIRQSLVLTWALLAISYATNAWMVNSIPAFMSALLASFAAFYFLKPFILLTRQDSSLKVYFIQLNSRWIALSVWASYSLLAITVLTWIRCSTPEHADPISLLLSGLSGNFLSDPEDGKRLIARVIGFVWVAVSAWAFLQKDKDASVADQLDAELKSL